MTLNKRSCFLFSYFALFMNTYYTNYVSKRKIRHKQRHSIAEYYFRKRILKRLLLK